MKQFKLKKKCNDKYMLAFNLNVQEKRKLKSEEVNKFCSREEKYLLIRLEVKLKINRNYCKKYVTCIS